MCSQQESFEIEKYKVTIERQKSYANLAREIFDKYSKIFVTLTAGTFALLSAKEKLEIAEKLILKLINGIAVLITFMGIVSIVQIWFALIRWYDYRNQEIKIDESQIKRWYAWTYEALYMTAIAASIVAVWIGACVFKDAIR